MLNCLRAFMEMKEHIVVILFAQLCNLLTSSDQVVTDIVRHRSNRIYSSKK